MRCMPPFDGRNDEEDDNEDEDEDGPATVGGKGAWPVMDATKDRSMCSCSFIMATFVMM
jgi:hypothetical protein